MKNNLTEKEYKFLTDVFCICVWDKMDLMEPESLYLAFQVVSKLKLNDSLLEDLKRAMGIKNGN